MLLSQQIEELHLPHAEAAVAKYILEQGSQLKGMSTRKIASKAYTTPATLVRLGQRLGFEGWTDFFTAFLEEREYLERHFNKIDANCPFSKSDNQTTIANKIAALHIESIQDTMALLDYNQLQKAVNCLLKSQNIYLVGVSVSLDCTWLFKRNMQRIGKNVILESNQGELFFSLFSATKNDCAIIVSYSGTTKRVVDAMSILNKQNIPTILITGLGNNDIKEKASHVIHMTTRERLSSKIGNFTTEVSTHLILDILYSCYFAENYEKNWDMRLYIAHQVEQYRPSKNQIMME